jgi:hypothetical protein
MNLEGGHHQRALLEFSENVTINKAIFTIESRLIGAEKKMWRVLTGRLAARSEYTDGKGRAERGFIV